MCDKKISTADMEDVLRNTDSGPLIFTTDADALIILHPVLMQIAMDDFQSIRAGIHNALHPEIEYLPDDPEQMRTNAGLLMIKHMTEVKLLLDKYEYMEQEGFAGPELDNQLHRNHTTLTSFVLDAVSDFSGAINPTTISFLSIVGIGNNDMPAFSKDIAYRFKFDVIPEEDYRAWETVNDVIEYIWNSRR